MMTRCILWLCFVFLLVGCGDETPDYPASSTVRVASDLRLSQTETASAPTVTLRPATAWATLPPQTVAVSSVTPTISSLPAFSANFSQPFDQSIPSAIWQTVGDFSTTNGTATTTATGFAKALLDSRSPNGTIRTKIVTGNTLGLIFRATDLNNFGSG